MVYLLQSNRKSDPALSRRISPDGKQLPNGEGTVLSSFPREWRERMARSDPLYCEQAPHRVSFVETRSSQSLWQTVGGSTRRVSSITVRITPAEHEI